jgi:hypothetical protein
MDMQVKSIACGLLDSIYDAIQLSGENNVSSSLIPNTTTEVMEIELPSNENTKCIAKEAGDSSKDNGNRHSTLSTYLLIVLGTQNLGYGMLHTNNSCHICYCFCRCCN